ncbi:hypothetical protein [Martelella limonii]|uniref:hypothetical protein n=1 Tax=Martelella limonii TaxID=1647649 RepID=UPI0015810DE5|nr:hypothetical protein [Martelella limonii]
MNVTNHVKKPFFEAPPERVKPIIEMHRPWVDSPVRYPTDVLYSRLSKALADAGFDAPTHREYLEWLSAEGEQAYYPSPYHPQEKGPEERAGRYRGHIEPKEAARRYRGDEAACAIGVDFGDASAGLVSEAHELAQAEAIVKAAHKLNEANLAAGYSPLSLHTDDTAVGEAIRTLVSCRPSPLWGLSPASAAVDLLLSQCDDEIDGAVLDALSMDMQRDLCAALVREMDAEDRAA